ncbi:unnamed protein product [Brachionus calyciflorus]|uniref:Metalloendopeptidase n=1 Tax=Brachionus calyciflorus TaxID=104777 RepID=A0A814G1R4_9BILA|nr:unnamed protein product [Brachionus calyciflorus]
MKEINEENLEEGDLFEGDIVGLIRGAAQKPTKTRGLWPNGIIPYEIDPIFPPASRDIILAGQKMIENATRINGSDCIKFISRTNEDTYIRVINGSGCWSYVGKKMTKGAQDLSLRSPGCMKNAIAAHEFMHAMGFWHEQSRPDRDNYIKVIYENIKLEKIGNFKKYQIDKVDYLNQLYDYDSVMHYEPKAFTSNGLPTIVPKEINAKIGQRTHLSQIDIAEIRALYNCK